MQSFILLRREKDVGLEIFKPSIEIKSIIGCGWNSKIQSSKVILKGLNMK